jgi:hypothetical protein
VAAAGTPVFIDCLEYHLYRAVPQVQEEIAIKPGQVID